MQAIGIRVAEPAALAQVGRPLRVEGTLRDDIGRKISPSPVISINGAPELVRDGRIHVTPATDGMVQPGNASLYYGWVHKRNPRTPAGVGAAGRTVLVTADGGSTDALGLSIPESAAVARALGLRDTVNPDGGGTTTRVVDGEVINDPSDAAGERPVGGRTADPARPALTRPGPRTPERARLPVGGLGDRDHLGTPGRGAEPARFPGGRHREARDRQLLRTRTHG